MSEKPKIDAYSYEIGYREGGNSERANRMLADASDPADAGDLIERLEGWLDYRPMQEFCSEALKDLREAASSLAALQQRVEELEAALTSALGGWEAAPPEVQDDYVDIEALRRVAKHRSEVEPGPNSYPVSSTGDLAASSLAALQQRVEELEGEAEEFYEAGRATVRFYDHYKAKAEAAEARERVLREALALARRVLLSDDGRTESSRLIQTIDAALGEKP